jgi:MFS family permease
VTSFVVVLIITLAVQVQASLVVFTPPILAPVAQHDVGVNAAAVGLVMALIYISSVPAALVSGKVIGRLGAIRVSQLCVLFCSCGMALMAIPNPWVIAAGALIIGLGYGAVTPASSTVLADKAPLGMRSLIFSIKQTGVPIGGAIAGALVPFLIVLIGWQHAAIAIALSTASIRRSLIASWGEAPGCSNPFGWCSHMHVFANWRFRRLRFPACKCVSGLIWWCFSSNVPSFRWRSPVVRFR